LLVRLASGVVGHALGPEVRDVEDREGFAPCILGWRLVADAESAGVVTLAAAVIITLWAIWLKDAVLYGVSVVWVDASPSDGERDPKAFFAS